MKKFKSLIVILTIMLVALTAIMPTISFAADEQETYTITIKDSDGNNVTGRTFEAYKLFDLSVSSDGNSYAYTMTDTLKAYFTENSITINSDQEAVEYINSLNADGLDDFAASYYAYCEENNVEADATSNSNVITINSKGYYLIYDTTTTIAEGETRSALMITTVGVTEDTEITIKTTTVDVDKTVDNTSATIGDDVTFTITSHVPDTSKYDTYEFVITDTVSSGLNIDTTSIEVKIGDITIESSNYTVSDVTTNTDGTKTFTITFNNAKTLFESHTVGNAITVTYTAEVTAAGEQSNSAKITYSNDPVDGGIGETGGDMVYVYSYTVQLTKVASDGTTTLSGATFELRGSAGNVVATATSGENGLVTFTGLAAGTYTLTETEAPDGYYLPTTSFNFTITENLDESGKLQTASVAWSDSAASEYVTYGSVKSVTADSVSSCLALVVYNYTTDELLPTTGGIGTTLFTMAGIAVMAIAVIALVARNRKSKRA